TRKSLSPRRRTRSGAITRAFAVSSNAPHDSPTPSAATSFETMRWRWSHASGPATRTNARGRRTTARDVTVATETSVGTHDLVPDKGGAEARRARTRSRAPAARAVPDGKVARPALGDGPEDGPLDVGLPYVR